MEIEFLAVECCSLLQLKKRKTLVPSSQGLGKYTLLAFKMSCLHVLIDIVKTRHPSDTGINALSHCRFLRAK
jgi:hypothetical protein